jgi:DNA-binding IscR family transcriptional regulator
VAKVLTIADQAASDALAKITIADLLAEKSAALDGVQEHPACTEAIRAAGAVAA